MIYWREVVLGKIWSLASIEITNLQHRNNLSNSISVLKFLWCSSMRCSWRWYIIWRFLNLDFQVEFTIISLKKKPSVFSWLSTYTVHAVQSGNALQLTNHILKWCFRVSTGCPVVFFILEEENTGPYLDRRFTSLVCIYLWLLLLSCYYSYWVCWRYSTYQLSKSDLLCKM